MRRKQQTYLRSGENVKPGTLISHRRRQGYGGKTVLECSSWRHRKKSSVALLQTAVPCVKSLVISTDRWYEKVQSRNAIHYVLFIYLLSVLLPLPVWIYVSRNVNHVTESDFKWWWFSQFDPCLIIVRAILKISRVQMEVLFTVKLVLTSLFAASFTKYIICCTILWG